jgi:hypothetical protein
MLRRPPVNTDELEHVLVQAERRGRRSRPNCTVRPLMILMLEGRARVIGGSCDTLQLGGVISSRLHTPSTRMMSPGLNIQIVNPRPS